MKFFDPQGDIEKTAHKLPHWQQGEVAIFVTFRLADSLPRELLDAWLRSRDAFLAANPPPWDDLTEACYHGPFSDKLDEHLDAAHGSCALREPRLVRLTQAFVVARLAFRARLRFGLAGANGSPNLSRLPMVAVYFASASHISRIQSDTHSGARTRFLV